MTCSLAWFEPATSHYGVAADRQFTGSQFSPLSYADKTAQVQAPGKAPLLLALAGDYGRLRHVQRWIKESQYDRVLESADGVERFLLDLHACASDGPRFDDFDSKATGRSGVHVVAAHATGLYKMESYAAVYHTPATQCLYAQRVICVGSAVEFVAGAVYGGMTPSLVCEPVVQTLVSLASVYLPQSIGCQTDSLSYAP
jgi:hypothetical protein